MKIKTRLYFLATLFALVLAIFLASAIYTNAKINVSLAEQERVSAVGKKIFRLDVLTYDYLDSYKEGPRKDWWQVYDEIGRQLTPSKFEEPQARKVLDEMITRHSGIGEDFATVLSGHEKLGFKEEERGPISRLSEEVEANNNNVFQLIDIIVQKRISLQRRMAIFNLSISGFLFLIVIAGAYSLDRKVVRPILKIILGTEIIAEGDFDYKITGIETKDEIGQLARALNWMTRSLKNITASREELNREIAERKNAETQLVANAKELRQKVIELERFRTATIDREFRMKELSEEIEKLKEEKKKAV